MGFAKGELKEKDKSKIEELPVETMLVFLKIIDKYLQKEQSSELKKDYIAIKEKNSENLYLYRNDLDDPFFVNKLYRHCKRIIIFQMLN